MTDARFPERWLNDRRLNLLSDAGFRLYVTALAWSVSNRTDGVVSRDDLRLMIAIDSGVTDELVKAGLWRCRKDEWVITDYRDTQTSRAQLDGLDRRRRQDRERAQRYRDRHKDPDSSRDSSRDDKGQDRTGQELPQPQDSSASASTATTTAVREVPGFAPRGWLNGGATP